MFTPFVQANGKYFKLHSLDIRSDFMSPSMLRYRKAGPPNLVSTTSILIGGGIFLLKRYVITPYLKSRQVSKTTAKIRVYIIYICIYEY